MARAHSVHIVVLNHRPIAAFTVKHELLTYLSYEWPRCPVNMRVMRLMDGVRGEVKDTTAEAYGLLLEEKD